MQSRCGSRQAIGRSQPWTSGAAPVRRSSSACRSAMETGPAAPLPIVHDPSVDLTSPTGMVIAAVPHAKTSEAEPSSLPRQRASMRLMTSRWIWLVPSKICMILASRI